MGVIYKITHLTTSKKYVGQTRNDPWLRWCSHVSEGRLHTDIKTKKNDFSFEIIECCPNSLLNDREIFWIKKLKTLKPDGLNSQVGGNSAHKGKNFLQEYAAQKKLEGRTADYYEYTRMWSQLNEYDEYERLEKLKSIL